MINKTKNQKSGKAFPVVRVAAMLLCATAVGGLLFLNGCGKAGEKSKIVVLDTDLGTDDAMALLAAEYLSNVHIDVIVASKGNASLEGATRNAIILKNYLGLDAKIVQGQLPKADENVDENENNTFHGNDGLANVSDEMIKEMGLTSKELNDYISYDSFCKDVLKYDEIEYIIIGPTTNLANLLDNAEFKNKLSKVYVMGGGISEFNCSHNTEFNFSKDPQSVKKVLESGKDITLFPLDLTNSQRVNGEQINFLEKSGTFKHYISFLKFNRQSNIEYNNIDAAVIHDIMPLLYLEYPEKFTIEKMNIEVDKYGAIQRSDTGNQINVAMGVEDTLLNDTLSEIFQRGC